MNLIDDSEKFIREAETCRETTDAFIELTKEQPNAAIQINLNEVVKFKLTDLGKDIFIHQYDEINSRIRELGGKPIQPALPKVDENGYTSMQLWNFMAIYGSYLGMGKPNVIEPLNLIYKPEC